jgi:type VI secretion system protein ImpE
MPVDQSLREGKLDESLAELQEQVRRDPSNTKHRIFLFQLLAILGQWERAMTQLKVLGEMDAATLAMVQTYREALKCEALRAQVFAGERTPMVLGEPEEWVAALMESLRAMGAGEEQQSSELRGRALEGAPTTSGSLDERTFEWIADADSRLGPVLEVIVNGKYYWVPFHRIRTVQIEEPSDLRDLVWMPANFTWANAGQTVGLIPTRYPGTEAAGEGELLMARRTEWAERGADVYVGLGQRMLATDSDEHPLMDVRLIDLNTSDGMADGPEAGG